MACRALAHIWLAITSLIGTPEMHDHHRAEFHREQALEILRKFPSLSIMREFEILEKRLNPAGASAALLVGWAENPHGRTFEEIKNAVTQRAWAVTKDIPGFMALLSVARRRAEGLLESAGIIKMQKTREENPPLAN
jgi:hypothetical protein